MLLYFCGVFYTKRLTPKVLPTPTSDIISCNLFPSCSLELGIFHKLEYFINYFIIGILQEIGIMLQPLPGITQFFNSREGFSRP